MRPRVWHRWPYQRGTYAPIGLEQMSTQSSDYGVGTLAGDKL